MTLSIYMDGCAEEIAAVLNARDERRFSEITLGINGESLVTDTLSAIRGTGEDTEATL